MDSLEMKNVELMDCSLHSIQTVHWKRKFPYVSTLKTLNTQTQLLISFRKLIIKH